MTGAQDETGSEASDFSALHTVYLNCTLKRAEEPSHAELLMNASAKIMRKNGVAVEMIRPSEQRIAFGVYPDMREHGWEHDDWPKLWESVKRADILVIGTPIWLGEESSVCRVLSNDFTVCRAS
jgi:multimeric flavodoxin WrbA